MVKKHLLVIFFLAVVSFCYAQPRFESKIFVLDSPKAGQPLQLQYDAKGKDLEFSDDVQAALFIYEDFQWKRERLKLEKNAEGRWIGSISTTPRTAFVAVKFFQGTIDQPDAFDNNGDKGYAIALEDASGKPIAGAYIGQAAMEVPTIAGGLLFGYYTEEPKRPADTNYLKTLAEKEEMLSGKQLLKYFDSFMALKKIVLQDQFPTYANELVKNLLTKKSLNEEEIGTLYQYAKYRLQDEALVTSISNKVEKEYPKGATARFVAFNNTKGSSPDRKEAIASYEEFLKKFPVSEWQNNPDRQAFIYYEVYRGLGAGYFDSKQFDKFTALYNDIDFRTGNEVMRWNIMRAYMFKLVGKDTLYQISATILPKLITRKNDNSYMNDFQDKAFADSNMRRQLDDRLFTHISLLNDLKKYEEARKYFFELSEEGRYANAELNEINLQVLEGLKDEKQILPLLEMSVRQNAMMPSMFNKLKSLYLEQHDGDEGGYEQYLVGLKSDKEKEEMKAYVDHNWVNYPMPDFRLENADGLYVTPADWKGKIVVVDFWATWCRPCIMAFPGMQLLVDKYAKDKDVAVYMVGTMQTGDYKNKSVNYVRGEGFRFNLLHDSVNPKTNEQDLVFKQLVPLFGDSSIPRKIIVKDGKVRYCSGGYSGSPSKLMDELSLAIETLRNEK